MSELTKTIGISVGRLITPGVVREVIEPAEMVRIIRSGVHFVLGDCADIIEDACRNSQHRKDIRVIFPSPINPDVDVRSVEAGLDPREVHVRLDSYLESLAARFIRLREEYKGRHTFELRTTMEPHRYHAIFSESQAILGIPFHNKASLTTSSLFLRWNDASKMILDLAEDFEKFFNRCQPYHLGDCKKLRQMVVPKAIEEPYLLEFKQHLSWVVQALSFIGTAFPNVNGEGATKADLSRHFNGYDQGECNVRLLEMERAGLVRKVKDNRQDDRDGRIITGCGKHILSKYRNYPFPR